MKHRRHPNLLKIIIYLQYVYTDKLTERKKTALCARLENSFKRMSGSRLTPSLRFTVMQDQLAITAKTLGKRKSESETHKDVG